MNILTNKITLCNYNRIENIIDYNMNGNYINCKFITNIDDKDINKAYKSFGIHVVPNFFLSQYEYFCGKLYKLSFNFDLEHITDIKIYNGKQWLHFKNSEKKNLFEEDIIFYFNTSSKWRIAFTNIINFTIQNINIQLYEKSEKKKILIIGGGEKWIKNEPNISMISSYGDSIYYYLTYYLKHKYNYEIFNKNMAQKESDYSILEGLIQFNDCIDISQRGLYNKEINFVNKLRKHITNNMSSICDHNINFKDKYPDYYNINYLLYTLPNIESDNSRYIGPGCDSQLFQIEKTDTFTILIDDCYYDPNINHNEHTPKILDKCISFLKVDPSIVVIRFGFKDNNSNFIDPYKNNIKNYFVIEDPIPLTEKSKLHNKANIWWGTHSESFGQEYLESAMSGCLLVYKKNYINKFFDQFYSLQYQDIDTIKLEDLLAYDKYKEQRDLALKYSWECVVDNVINIFYP